MDFRLVSKYRLLRAAKGQHTELISLYIPFSKSIIEVINRLRQEIAESQNIKSKSNRKNVLQNITAIISILLHIKEVNTGWALFAKEGKVISIKLPENKIYLYKCDNSFYLEPLEEIFVHVGAKIGLVVLDSGEAAIGLYKNKNVIVLSEMDSYIPGKTIKGGQSARRYTEIIKNEKLAFAKKVSDKINIFFKQQKLNKILVGGIYPALDAFMDLKYVDSRLQKLYSAPYRVSYPDSYGLKVLVKLAAEDIAEIECISDERKLVAFQRNVKNGRATLSLEKAIEHITELKEVLITTRKMDELDLKVISIFEMYENIRVTVLHSEMQVGRYLDTLTGFIGSYEFVAQW